METTAATGKLDRMITDYDHRYGTKVKTNLLHSTKFSRERSAVEGDSHSHSVDNVVYSKHNPTDNVTIDNDRDIEESSRKSAHLSYDHYNI